MRRLGEQVEHLARNSAISSRVVEKDCRFALLLPLLTPAQRGVDRAAQIGGRA
jgi:hypothetical protein